MVIRRLCTDSRYPCVARSTLNMAAAPADVAGWTSVRGTLQCEPPNADLHVFKGRFDLDPSGAPSAANCLTPASRSSGSRMNPTRAFDVLTCCTSCTVPG